MTPLELWSRADLLLLQMVLGFASTHRSPAALQTTTKG